MPDVYLRRVGSDNNLYLIILFRIYFCKCFFRYTTTKS